jgi:hypothetical protein
MGKTYKINELINIIELLGLCKNDKDLKHSSTSLTGIRLTRKINTIRTKHFEEQEELFKRFDVSKVEKDGKAYFDWTDRSQEEQNKINQAVTELTNTDYTVEGFNAIDEEDFIIYTRGLQNNAIVFLYDYLVIES